MVGERPLPEIGFRDNPRWPLPNVHIGVSVEDQATAEERIPILADLPAAVRWVSYEPALGPVNFRRLQLLAPKGFAPGVWLDSLTGHVIGPDDLTDRRLDWIVVGGESGPGARPCDISWFRDVLRQRDEAALDAGNTLGGARRVPIFVKQLGARPYLDPPVDWMVGSGADRDRSPYLIDQGGRAWPVIESRKGGDPGEWPEDLRVRELPS